MLNNQLRIIAGKWRGRKLQFPDSKDLRPTSDRMRETLFNWLQQDIHDAVCLDAFAGSGAIGFEALSRGAAEVIMLDESSKVIDQLKQNIKLLEAENITLRKIDAIKYLKECDKQFDLIFLDPPFQSDLLGRCLDFILERKLLREDGFVYLEQAKSKVINVSDTWSIVKEKQMGDVQAALINPVFL